MAWPPEVFAWRATTAKPPLADRAGRVCIPGCISATTESSATAHRSTTVSTTWRAARRAGYVPTIFGYADQSIDPRVCTDRSDPRRSTYQGFPPGFDVGLDLPDEQDAWRTWLEGLGYGSFGDGDAALATEAKRPAEHGVSAFLTNQLIEWMVRQDDPWFVHASYWRPHPPYAAAGHWSRGRPGRRAGSPGASATPHTL